MRKDREVTRMEAAKERVLVLLRDQFPNKSLSVDQIAAELEEIPREIILQACLRLKRNDKKLLECFRFAND